MLKNFVKNDTPFQDIINADGSKTYDTVYGMITIRKDLVMYVEAFLSGTIKKAVFTLLLEKGKITQDEYNKIIRIID
jgi:hypothetical protein